MTLRRSGEGGGTVRRYVPRPVRRALLTHREERGNFFVTTALILTVLIGMLALVIDIGFAAGQRRFMQNGADAAALAVADLLSGSVSPWTPVSGPWPENVRTTSMSQTPSSMPRRSTSPRRTGTPESPDGRRASK